MENIIKTIEDGDYKVLIENSYGVFEMIAEDDKGGSIKNKNDLIEGFSEVFPTLEIVNVIDSLGNNVLLFKDTLKKSILIFEKVK